MLVCDEVTSALDVSVQAAIVELLAELQRDLGLAMLFVTHNLPLVRSIAGRVAVMSLGRIVELGLVEQVINAPADEYTQRLLVRHALPRDRDGVTGTAGRRPNVLLLMVDQLAAGWLPAYGHDVTRAPHLTALAREGVTFEHAYCASPLCGPSRSAMLTGRLPSATGVFDNAAEWQASTPTVVHALRAAGYATALAGKMHFVGPDQLHGYEERLTTDVYPASFDWTPDWRLAAGERLPWYHNTESLLQAGVRESAMQTDYDDEVAFHAVRKLRELARGGDGRPFFLTVSFTNPHDPWEVRSRHWELYEGDGRGRCRDRPGVGSAQPAPARDVRAGRAAAHRR